VLHGSDRPLEVVEPQTPTIVHEDPLSNQHAIYASMTVEVPIFRAVMRHDLAAPAPGINWHLNTRDACWDVRGSGLRFTTGYIHVLPREHFEMLDLGITCLCRVPVRTERIHKVDPSILTRLKGVRLSPELIEGLNRYLQGDETLQWKKIDGTDLISADGRFRISGHWGRKSGYYEMVDNKTGIRERSPCARSSRTEWLRSSPNRQSLREGA